MCALIDDREDQLACRHNDLVLVHLDRQTEELKDWFDSSKEVLEKPIPVLGEATFEDTKKVLGNYRVSCALPIGLPLCFQHAINRCLV